MNDAVLVGRRQATQYLGHQIHSQGHRQQQTLLQQHGERLAVEQLHDHEQQSVGCAAQVEHIDDVRMTDGAGGSRLAFEAGGQVGIVAQFLAQRFDGHSAFKRDVQPLVDHPHGASADLAGDLVLAIERLADAQAAGREGRAYPRACDGAAANVGRMALPAMRTGHGPRISAALRPVSIAPSVIRHAGTSERPTPNT